MIPEELRGLKILQEVLRWGFAQSPPLLILEVVVQDEYSHDMIAKFGDHYLCFDTT
jgi:hypothetical protein